MCEAEYINVIMKKDVMAVPFWLAALGACICIGLLASAWIYWAIVKDSSKTMQYFCVVGTATMALCLTWNSVTSIFFSEPTGRYKYAATINKEVITISQYEEFIEEYNPTIKDGIYYWED